MKGIKRSVLEVITYLGRGATLGKYDPDSLRIGTTCTSTRQAAESARVHEDSPGSHGKNSSHGYRILM